MAKENGQFTYLLDILRNDVEAEARIRRALEGGFAPDTRGAMDKTLLMHAVSLGKTAVVELLLSFRADAGLFDDQGFTPLHTAVAQGDFYVADRLIGAGAALEARDPLGRLGLTPLHVAFNADLQAGQKSRIAYLLEKGASLDARNNAGSSVLDVARTQALRFPFAGELLLYMQDFAQNKAAEDRRAVLDAFHHAAHGGTVREVAVRPMNVRRRHNPAA